jgi:hypothetical protein
MTLSLTITMDNAAFEPTNGTEAAAILRRLAKMIDIEKGLKLKARKAKR